MVDGGGVDNGNVLVAVAVTVAVVVAVTVAVMVVAVAVTVVVMAVVTVAVEEVVKKSVVAHVCRVVGLQFTIFKRSLKIIKTTHDPPQQ